MMVSQKCQYAMRAVFELTRRQGDGPISANEIAQAQEIPVRFLEAILGQLRLGGVVISRRGKLGGFLLARPPQELTVGTIIRLIDGAIYPVERVSSAPNRMTQDPQPCACLSSIWDRAREALESVYDSATFADLAKQARERVTQENPSVPF